MPKTRQHCIQQHIPRPGGLFRRKTVKLCILRSMKFAVCEPGFRIKLMVNTLVDLPFLGPPMLPSPRLPPSVVLFPVNITKGMAMVAHS